MEMFGRYYEELEGRMKELRQAVDGGLSRSRRAMLERVDELSAGLHRDMMTFRQEQQREMEELKRDVFTAVMSLSAINDRISAAEMSMSQRVDTLQHALTLLAKQTAPQMLAVGAA
jgi:hypothetical protein